MQDKADLYWQGSKVNCDERSSITKTKGKVIWLTGLSGSGKSTLAIELEKRLIDKGKLAFCIDGDDIRKSLGSDLGFAMEDRAEHIRRVAHVAGLFRRASIVAIVSAISPLKEMRELARKIIGTDFREVYVSTSLETCIKRDPKGLYAKVRANEIKQFTGVSSEYEPPKAPDLWIDTEAYDIESCVNKLLELVESMG